MSMSRFVHQLSETLHFFVHVEIYFRCRKIKFGKSYGTKALKAGVDLW